MGLKGKRNKSLFFLIVTFLIASERTAAAYLDPGTGSYVFQIIIAGIVGGLFAVKIYWKKLIDLVKNGPARKKEDNEK